MIRFPPFFVLLCCLVVQQPSFSLSRTIPFQSRKGRIGGLTASPTSQLVDNGLVVGVDSPAQIEKKEFSREEEALQAAKTKEQQQKHCQTIFFISLMGLSGCIEGICFRRFRVFPNMMTGNTVRCLDALVDGRLGDFRLYVTMISCYVTGGALFKSLDKLKAFPKTPNMIWLARLCFACFAISDIVGRFVKDHLRLIPMAIACGMINAATQEVTGAVTNAVTGHYSKIGLGIGETLALQLQSSPKGASSHDDDKKTKSSTMNPTLKKSLQGVSSFALGLLLTNFVFQFLESRRPLILARLPPLGISFGVLYTALFTWYNRATGER